MADKPLRYSSSFPLKTIIANAGVLSFESKEQLKEQGCLFDDDGANHISHLNPWWGELTAVHWLLQQPLKGVIGNAQYRRFWSDDSLSTIVPGTLYLCEPCLFSCSLSDQFRGGHGFPGVEMTMEMAAKGCLPFTEEEMAQVWAANCFQGGPMAIGEWKLYRRLMTVLFDCLWPLWQAYEHDLRALQGYDQRAIAFLSERLLSGIILMKDKFLPDVTLKSIPLHYIAP